MKIRFATFLSILLLVTPLFVTSLLSEDWSAFRGPAGNGVSNATNVPVNWGNEQNVAWKADLPGKSNGSPVVSAGHVFLTSADHKGHERNLHCFSLGDGAEAWVRTVKFDKTLPTHKTNLYGGTTPAADGKRIVVWHGSAGLLCYDFSGTEIWKRELGEFRHQWGYGTSPVIHEDKVILHSGPGASVFVAAFDLDSGDTVWKTDEPVENDGERNDANKYMGSWSTPVITTVAEQTLAVCSMSTRVNAYDVRSGEIVFTCDGLRGTRGDLAYTSPVMADDICIAMGGFTGPAMGFRMAGTGNITEQQRLWRVGEKNPQRIGSGVFVDGFIYMANAGPNLLECIEPRTGKVLWKERSGGAHWGSIVYADDRLYTTDQDGTTLVFRPNPKRYEPIATNPNE